VFRCGFQGLHKRRPPRRAANLASFLCLLRLSLLGLARSTKCQVTRRFRSDGLVSAPLFPFRRPFPAVVPNRRVPVLVAGGTGLPVVLMRSVTGCAGMAGAVAAARRPLSSTARGCHPSSPQPISSAVVTAIALIVAGDRRRQTLVGCRWLVASRQSLTARRSPGRANQHRWRSKEVANQPKSTAQHHTSQT
jgi:hypothetical protein